MGWDLDDILEAAGARRDAPSLIEVCRKRGRGATTGYFWSTGRVMATVGSDRVRIKRRLGLMTDGVTLDLGELRALAIATADWAKRRDEWAAFYFSGSGYPPGFGGGATWYQPPGRRATRLKLGERGPLSGTIKGERLVGRDDIVPIEPRARSRAHVAAEIWRRGERHGPIGGSLVGFRYALGGALQLDARRIEAMISRVDRDVMCLEPGEEQFVAAVVDAVDGVR